MCKKIALLITLTMIGTLSFAQVKLGVRAGLNLTNLSQHKNGQQVSGDFQTGFHAGLTADIKINNPFFFQSGILYTTKGFKNADAVKVSTTARYVEIPLNIIYKPPIAREHLFVGLGPYIAYGLGGKWNMPASSDGPSPRPAFSGDLQFVNDTHRYNYYFITPGEKYTFGKALDWGFNILVGGAFQQFSIQLNGQFGMANIAPKVDGEATSDKLRNVGIGLSVGYKFW